MQTTTYLGTTKICSRLYHVRHLICRNKNTRCTTGMWMCLV